MATNTLDTFYVLLTNVSTRPQAVFRTSNSWGYYAISFQLWADDGRMVAIIKTPTGFTRNIPSTFALSPGEQMVYPIKLDDAWMAGAPLPVSNERDIEITLKAVYQIEPTPEATERSLWTGRIESAAYRFQFRHWVN